MLKRIIVASLASVIVPSLISAQQPETLVVGRKLERPLAVGNSHPYMITADSGRFVAGVAMQDGIDLQVIVLGPKGDTLGKFDSPNGARGAEPFNFNTKARGSHRIIVAPFTTATGSGRYTLVLNRVEPVAKTPGARVDQMMAGVDPAGPGVVMAVVRNGQIAYQHGWGLANLTHKIPFTVDKRTNIGSTSKQFTAFAILLLADQKKLSLEDDVRKHIPELPDFGKTVTIRNLLTHTSGYREFLNALAIGGRRLDYSDYIARSEIIDLVKRQPRLQNDPGAEFNYNNTGFALLAVIVERVSGKAFPDFMRENVFAPLGMKNTFVRTPPGEIIPNSAQGYVVAGAGWREAEDIPASMGAGGIYTTIGDLALWMRNFHSAAFGPAGFFKTMTTRNVLSKGDTTGYGLGLVIDKWRGLARVQHGGADNAHRSAFVYYPEIDAGVIVQSNNGSVNPESYASQAAEVFFADRLAPLAAPGLAKASSGPFQFDSAKFNAFAGKYELTEMKGFILAFTRRGAQYFGQATGQPEFEMFPTSDSTFTLKVVNASVTFHREANGAVNRMTLHQGGDHAATRVVEGSTNLADYVGRYFSDELETFYNIALENDTLKVTGRRTEPAKLARGSGENFTGGFPLANLVFERDAAGKVTGFRAGNGRSRDILFRKVE